MSRIENILDETNEYVDAEKLESINSIMDSLNEKEINEYNNDKNNNYIKEPFTREPYIVFTRFFKEEVASNDDFLLFEIYAEGEGPGKGYPLMQGFGTSYTVWRMIDSFMACANITQEALKAGIVMGCINIVEKRAPIPSDDILRWDGIPIFRHKEEE